MKEQVRFATAQWGLHSLQAVYEREHSAVWLCQSRRFGPAVLKWNSTGSLEGEYRMLSGLQGNGCCMVYGYDKDRGLLLEERILPGTVLRQEPSPEKRAAALAQVFRTIHSPSQKGETYLAWLEKARHFCTSHTVPETLLPLTEEALEICRGLFARHPERVLLHGDLHHDNLLRREDGTYAAIDPKGVIGPEILDLPRFLLNEADFDGDPAHMERMVSLVSRLLGYPEEELYQALFMEAVLAAVWCVEDGIPLPARWQEQITQYEKRKTEKCTSKQNGWN